MSEPTQSPAVEPSGTPRPFGPGPPPATGPGGCGKPMVIGCAVLVLLLGIAAIGLFLKAGDLFGWALERFEAEIVKQLPEDLDAAEEARLSAAFAAARKAVVEGRADPFALQRLQEELRETTVREQPALTREDVEKLSEALEAVAAGGSEDLPPPDR